MSIEIGEFRPDVSVPPLFMAPSAKPKTRPTPNNLEPLINVDVPFWPIVGPIPQDVGTHAVVPSQSVISSRIGQSARVADDVFWFVIYANVSGLDWQRKGHPCFLYRGRFGQYERIRCASTVVVHLVYSGSTMESEAVCVGEDVENTGCFNTVQFGYVTLSVSVTWMCSTLHRSCK